MKRIESLEARDSGLLQEVNRLWLNPRGFALGLESQSNQLRFAKIDRPISDWTLSREKAERFSSLAVEGRLRLDSPSVVGIEGVDDSRPILISGEEDTIQAFVEAMTGAGIQENEDSEGVRRWLTGFLARCRLGPDGVIEGRKVEEAAEVQPKELARAVRLLRQLLRDPRIYQGEEPPISNELYDHELAEVKALDDRLGSEAKASDIARLEELFGLAQEGMRFWRGDDDARQRWKTVKAEAERKMAKHRAGLSELSKFLDGELCSDDLTDIDSVRSQIEDLAGPLRAQVAQLEAERLSITVALEPLERRLREL